MQSLNGVWQIATDPENVGRKERWFESGVPASARPVPVPGIIQQAFPDYHGVAWYYRTFTPQFTVRPGHRCLLRFGAVDYIADVWLNGIHVGGHEGGETPFDLDISHALEPGSENLLVVRVLNPTDEPIDGIRLCETPHRNKFVKGFQPGMSYNYGGIVQAVELRLVPSVRITDLFARPRMRTGEIELTVTVRNDSGSPLRTRLGATLEPAMVSDLLDRSEAKVELPPGESRHETTLCVAEPHLWSLENPYLYRVEASLEASGHRFGVRCGFREFRVDNGWFYLNGKRVFLRSTHTGNHYPIGWVAPQSADFIRRDLYYVKASGFNCVRFIAGMGLTEQMDFCDELGLMVYEEHLASWCLGESPKMAERYDLSLREMILRDRNHPCVTIWGLLNETGDGAVFRHCVEALSLVRSLDDTRLVLLGSGRWDRQRSIGSVSNPGSREWEHVWGAEAPGATPSADKWDHVHGGYFEQAGDAHVYPAVPHPPVTLNFIRTLGRDTKPVFLSEYGIGSLFNAFREARMYEQVGARPDLRDARMCLEWSDKIEADWKRFGMEGVYPFAEDMLRDSQRLHARQRLLGFDLIRSNPKICGFNLTGMLDHGLTGEGLWTFWREWKPGIVDALSDGWAPLRWCLFATPLHGYAGRPVRLEAVLATEDVLRPGEYPATFRICGKNGIAYEKRTVLRVPENPPLAIPVLNEQVVLDEPGEYEFAARLDRGGCPHGGRLKFRVTDAARFPKVRGAVTVWGIAQSAQSWLEANGIACRRFGSGSGPREVILVGLPEGKPSDWRELAARMARGSTVVFLQPAAFKEGDDAVRWLPLEHKGRCYEFHDWLYHKECVAKAHPIFEGLHPKGIMDWDYYDQVIPRYLFDTPEKLEDVAAAAFAVGYCCPGGYASGVLVASHPFGAGRFVLSSLRVLDNLGKHPAADRLLLNLVSYARRDIGKPTTELPTDFEELLHRIGYTA